MSIDNKFVRVEDDDPRRCQAVGKGGQCFYQACEHSQYCPRHNGHKGGEAARKQVIHSYQLAKWQSRMGEHANSDTVKSLRGEIGILRMMIETMVVQCKDDMDLLSYASPINKLIDNVNKVVTNCDRLETKMGMLLDRAAMIVIAGQIVTIIGRYVEDEDVLQSIAAEIITAISSVNGPEPKDET